MKNFGDDDTKKSAEIFAKLLQEGAIKEDFNMYVA